jgi:hypothetical protein
VVEYSELDAGAAKEVDLPLLTVTYRFLQVVEYSELDAEAAKEVDPATGVWSSALEHGSFASSRAQYIYIYIYIYMQ